MITDRSETLTLEEAYQRCHALTREHYENFPVARLVPRSLRPHVSAIYAFARTADDLADEGWGTEGAPSPEERVAVLDEFEVELEAAVTDRPLRPETAWIFLALGDTVRKKGIPVQLLRDLLSAFRQDCVKLEYASYEELLDYCRRSANPIGRLVLILHGQNSPQHLTWSDHICTGLQLANFWQDVGVDWLKDGRIYVPREDWQTFGVERSMFGSPKSPAPLRDCLRFQVERTRSLFQSGKPLGSALPFPLSLEIKLTWHGGMTILRKIEGQQFDTLVSRPRLRKHDLPMLMARALAG